MVRLLAAVRLSQAAVGLHPSSSALLATYTTATTPVSALLQHQHQTRDGTSPEAPVGTTAGSSQKWRQVDEPFASSSNNGKALAMVPQKKSLALRTLETALNGLHRLVMLVSSIRHMSANEAYVASYLERRVGFDSFTIEYLHIARPRLFRLSVAHDIEPVVCWLRSIGVQGEELVELVRHTPSVLSASVDEQLEPLAALIASLGGSPAAVLKAFPDLSAVPLAALTGTRHVLRQLGAADHDIGILLLRFPDLYAELALTLQRLFSDFAVAGWRLHARQRRQLGGAIHHHMTHWNAGKRRSSMHADSGDAPPAGWADNSGGTRGQQHAALQRHDQRQVAHDGELRAQCSRVQHVPRSSSGGSGGGGPPGAVLTRSSYIIDRGVYSRLVQVVAALESVSMQDDGEGRDAAVDHLEQTIERLGEIAPGGGKAAHQQQAALQAAG